MEYICKPGKLAIYVNSGKKTTAQIKAETGCTALINGGLFDMTHFSPLCHLKVEGRLLAKDKWGYYGFGWNDATDLDMVVDYAKFANYICCVEMVRNGKATDPMIYPEEMGGYRPRSAFGVFPDGRVWLYADTTKLTPEGLRAYAMSIGVKHAIMLDGGNSTQGASPDGTVNGGRKVHNYICVWEHGAKGGLDILKPNYKWAYNPGKRSGTNFLILHHAAGNGTPEAIHSYHKGKGWAGIAYHYYVRKDGTVYEGRPEEWKGGHTTGYNNELGICFEGDFEKEQMGALQAASGKLLIEDILRRHPTLTVKGHKELGSTSCPGRYFEIRGYYPKEDAPAKGGEGEVFVTLPILKNGSRGGAVKTLQILLSAKGYNCGAADGIFGAKTDAALKQFQRAFGLDADGICGEKSWTALLT